MPKNESLFSYTPPASLAPFFSSDARVRMVRGPVGSTKSTAMVMELFRRSCQQEPGDDGTRRTRFCVVRNTLPQIKETCLVTIRKTLGPLVNYKVSEHKIIFSFNDVYSEWLFLPLDSPENIQRLLSLEITGAWVSEFREINPEIMLNVLSRCGRYPAALGGGVAPSWHGLIAETNSFSEDSPWFELLETDLNPNWFYLVQPGAYDAAADWLQYLPSNYYPDLLENNGEAWARQYVHNEVSPSLSSQAVFAKSFDQDYHVTPFDKPLRFVHSVPLVLGLDTGRHPAFVAGQIDPSGRLNILHSDAAENMGIETFINERIMPVVAERFERAYLYAIVDPAGRQRSQIGEESVIEAITRCGIPAYPASTNQIAPRLRAVEGYLNRRNGILIDAAHNQSLIKALRYGYRYPRNKEQALKEVPEKSHPYSDLCLHARELVATSRGNIPMGELAVGDFVQTPWGLDEVVAVSLREADLVRVALGDEEFLCTPDHLVAVASEEGRYIRADELQYGDVLFFGGEGWGSRKVESIRVSEQLSESVRSAGGSSRQESGKSDREKGSSVHRSAPSWLEEGLKGLRWTGNGSPLTPVMVTIGTSTAVLMLPSEFHSTAMCGRNTTGLFPKGLLFTTKTMIGRITQLRTWSLCLLLSMRECIRTSEYRRALSVVVRAMKLSRKRGSGTNPRKDARGTVNTPNGQRTIVASNWPYSGVRDVAMSMSGSLGTVALSSAPAARSVVSVSCAGTGLVVNLTTRQYHQYYAAGVLNHNCDSLQYLCLGVENRMIGRQVQRLRGLVETPPEPRAAGWT